MNSPIIPSTVLIIGCTSGIGEAVCRSLKKYNYNIIGTSRNSPNDPLVDKHIPLDLEILESCIESQKAFINVVPDTEKLFAIVLCSGILEPRPALLFDSDYMKKILTVNFTGHVLILKMLRHRIYQDKPKIMYVGSISSHHAAPFLSGYSATKAAVKMYFEGLRRELAGTNIQICYAELGNVDTGFSVKSLKGIRTHEFDELGLRNMWEKFKLQANNANVTGANVDQTAAILTKNLLRKQTPAIVRTGKGFPRSFILRVLPKYLSDWLYRRVLGKADI